jgi:hypothetical protein
MVDSVAEAVDAGIGSEEGARNVRKAAIITASTGIAHSILIVLAFFLIRNYAPGVDATDAEILEFIENSTDRRIVIGAGIYLIPFAGIAFIWFTVAIRMWLSGSVHRLTPLFANLLLVCGVIYVALLFCAGASMSVFAISAEYGDSAEDLLEFRQFTQYGSSLLLVFAMRVAAMMVFALSNIGKTHGVLPRWFVFLGIVLGVLLLLTASLSPGIMLLFPAWLLVLAIILLKRARHIPKSETIAEARASQRANLLDIQES